MLTIRTILELNEKIQFNVDSFDKFLRSHFDFSNVRILHDDKVDYLAMSIHDDFLTVTLHDCAEIQDFLFISLEKEIGFEEEKEYEWEGISLYISHYYDEMD